MPKGQTPIAPQDVGIQQARPLDLFFDLVFVFAVTQVTGLLAHPHSGFDYLQALLAGFTIAGLYNAFVWLTGNTNFENDSDAWLMLLAMGSFFVMALAVPSTSQAGPGAIAFGIAAMLANALHSFMFSRLNNSSSQAILEVAPYNFTSSLLVLLSAFAPGMWHWGLWLAALAVYAIPISKRSSRRFMFSLSPRHFAERHGLLIIIALGESIMGMGLGAKGLAINLTLLAYVFLGLMLAANLWWSYFGPDNARAEHRLVSAPPAQRVILAANFGLTHFLMLFGIIFTAAALEVGIHEPTHHAESATAWNLAIGISLFFWGDVAFRRAMGIGPSRLRMAVAVAALCTAPIGLHFSAVWQLFACVALLGAMTLVEDYLLEPKRAG